MNKTMITLAIACAFVEVGCSSVPTPVVPDGGNRQPANTQAKIDDYKARTAEEIANYNERTALSRQVESLNKQIAELKAYMVLLQMDKENKHPKTQAVSHTAAPVKRNAAPARALQGDLAAQDGRRLARQPAAARIDGQRSARRDAAAFDEGTAFALGTEAQVLEEQQRVDRESAPHIPGAAGRPSRRCGCCR